MLTVTLNVLLLRRWSFIIIYLFIWLKRKKGVASNILDISVAVAHAQTFTHSKCDFIFITPFKGVIKIKESQTALQAEETTHL